MITLYAYPELFGLEGNNPYGLKVFAFLPLCGLRFTHRHETRSGLALPYGAGGNGQGRWLAVVMRFTLT
ncbi:hypothetical protein [Cupriavidus basilensis]|uniref:hypothetical protein n=1 Tax=Cupriavidus basilensis TaxID=68895 RepID=UPI003F5C074F